MKNLFIALITVFSVLLSTAYGTSFMERDPLGENAHYELVRGDRTTGLIKKGIFDAEILEYNPDTADGPIYIASLKYDIKATFIGRHKGELRIDIPFEYFSPEFILRLRKETTIKTPKFTVTHLGYDDAETKNGQSYENCDKLKIYNIKISEEENNIFVNILKSIVSGVVTSEANNLQDNQIKDLEIVALRAEEIPVLGAVQLDVKGKIRGYRFKAGLDYTPNEE